MKTAILLATFVLLTSTLLYAQIDKGRVQVGGSVGFNHQDISYPPGNFRQKYTTFNVSPSLGMFYKKNKMYGAFLNFSYYQSNLNSSSLIRTYGGGIFFRQYQPIANKLYLLFDERASYSYQSGNEISNQYDANNVNAYVQTGIAYDIKKRIQLEFLLNNLFYAGYSHSSYGNSFNIGSSLENLTLSNVGFGFRYYLK